jgi:hypothetical protein
MSATIERLIELPVQRLAELIVESEAFQMRLVRRLVDEWTSGANRFGRPGEALFAAEIEGRVIGSAENLASIELSWRKIRPRWTCRKAP